MLYKPDYQKKKNRAFSSTETEFEEFMALRRNKAARRRPIETDGLPRSSWS